MFQNSFIIVALFFFVTSCSDDKKLNMAEVPAGAFVFGSDLLGAKGGTQWELLGVEQGALEKPLEEGPAMVSPVRGVQKIELPAFYIDKFEVTNGEYEEFVNETQRKEPPIWKILSATFKERKDHPVTFVSYDDAAAYCKWRGKELPSEKQWEKAARGTDGRTYPWGEGYGGKEANATLSGETSTTPAGHFTGGQSPYGIFDMSGNVWEWTSSDYGDAIDNEKVIKGGSWGLSHRFISTFSYSSYPGDSKLNNLGFRCSLAG